MKFSCEKILLQTAISLASRAAAAKSSIPALEGVLLQAGPAGLTISGYNMNTGIRTTLEADITETGALVLSTRLFGDIIRRMPDDVVVFASDEKLNVTLTCGDAFFNISALSADDYPELPEVEDQYSFTLPQSTLRAMISDTSFAVSTDEVRPIHTGSLFEVGEGELTVVSVDGFRLALRREKLENSGADFRFVAPGTALGEVAKICQDVDDPAVVTLGNRHLLFEVGSTQLICRRLEGDFLDYRTAIPKNNSVSITANTRGLMDSIDRVSVVISDKQKSPVRCVFGDGQVTFSARTAAGDAKDVCRIEGDGGGLEIGFNNRYLLDALKYAPAETVKISLNSSISPCVITPVEGEESFVYMVLPVRLKNG